MPYYHIWTIGCQMNKAESARLGRRFEAAGYAPAARAEDASLAVVNSCVVRQHAEDKVVNRLYYLGGLKKKNPAMMLAVTGCLVEKDIAPLKKRFPFVDYFFRPGEPPPWLPADAVIPPVRPAPTVYVPIIQGCNNFCTYCVVPYRRGRQKSRMPQEIYDEVVCLVKSGVKEVVLVGQNVDAYGHDLPEKPDLAGLLYLLRDIDGLCRIRFLTNHPQDMSERLIEAIAALPKVCREINLPFQAGSDEILKKMRRGYTADDYRRLVGRLRERMPDIALSTDVIVGFPGETDEQFGETVSMLEEIRFDAVHVAVYSIRPGTIAAREFRDDVPAPVKKARLEAVESLQAGIAAGINAGLLGQKLEVLVEGRKKGKWHGRTRSGKLVFFAGDGEDLAGKLVCVKIQKTSSWSLQGTRDRGESFKEEQ